MSSSSQGSLRKHVLIMSPCLQLCKHILTLCSTLCCNWNLAQSQCWKEKNREAPVLQKEMEQPRCWRGKSEKDGWDIRNYSSPLCMGGGRKESKVCKLKDKKQITPFFGGEGRGRVSEVRILLVCYISQSVYKWNADRKFYSSLTVQQELHPSPDAGIRSPLPVPIWGGDRCVEARFPLCTNPTPGCVKEEHRRRCSWGKLQRSCCCSVLSVSAGSLESTRGSEAQTRSRP